jgi:hypothetical protein
MKSMFSGALNRRQRFSPCKPGYMQIVILVLLLSLPLSVPGICRANETCPWLNEATAAGFLDGSLTGLVTYPQQNKDDANCVFIHRDGAVVATLQIEVKTMSAPSAQFPSHLAECGPNPKPVKAIGNEAVSCSLDRKNGKFSESVVGRVRDRAFVVRINAKGDPSVRATMAVRVRKIAEQVAGILF